MRETSNFLQWVLLSWLIYPAVSVVVVVVLNVQSIYTTKPYPEWLSLFKDVAYGIGDVIAKAILAFYVAARALDISVSL